MKIHDINDSDLSKEEKDKQMADVYKMAFGVIPITGMRITGSGSDIVIERKQFSWFTGNDKIDVTKTNDRIPSWFMEETEQLRQLRSRNRRKETIVQRVHDFFSPQEATGASNLTDSSETMETTEIKNRRKLCP
jgi:hypothetical protein